MLDASILSHIQGDHLGAVRLLQEILDLDSGNAHALFNLGLMYDLGGGVEQNTEKALELYEQAHAAGNARATFSLGAIYDEGDGVEQNKEKALELYEQAHAAGNADAAARLGVMLNEGLEQDKEKALELY